jgi:transcriptional regulator with XRE-family HTH domain
MTALQAIPPALAELADTANREHEAAQTAAASMIEHAALVGDALLAARLCCPPGMWDEWKQTNLTFSSGTASIYIRIARFRDFLDARTEPVTSLSEARRILTGVEDAVTRGPSQKLDNSARKRVRSLRAEGLSLRAIAERSGVSETTIRCIVDPAQAQRRRERIKRDGRERRAATRALDQQRRQAEIKKALVAEGQAFNEAYRLVTRLDQLLGQARTEAATDDRRRAINEAHAHRDRMMDALIRALGVS